MPGSVTFTPGGGSGPGSGVPLARGSAITGVYLFDPAYAPGAGRYTLVSNVRLLAIDFREGADPPAARFRYTADDPLGNPNDPTRIEDMYPLDAQGWGVLKTDDQLVAVQLMNDNTSTILFHGYFQTPQADLGPQVESVTFTCAGGPIREWDTPLAGALIQDYDPATPTIVNIQTDLPARFNPEGHPNATAAGNSSGTAPDQFPTFFGPNWPKNELGGITVREWTLAMAVKYILAQGNKNRTYTEYPDLDSLDALLKVVQPKTSGGTINLTDPTTFTKADIEVTDFEVTGEVWPEALWRLLEPHNFAFKWVLEAAEEDSEDGLTFAGDPTWRIVIYDRNDNTNLKTVSLQKAGNELDPGATNLGGMSLARDVHDLANQIILDTKPTSWECSFILSYGFTPNAADQATPEVFIEGNTGFTGANIHKYRDLIFDELGEGHWDQGTNTFVTNARGSFSKLLDPKSATPRPYSFRRRPGLNTLHTKDELGIRFQAKLHVGSDYLGSNPGIYDSVAAGAGHWLEISSGWQLMKDRLGVRITVPNPNSWGHTPSGDPALHASLTVFDGKISMIDMCNAIAPNPKPIFMLTCTISDDQDFNVISKFRQTGTPTKYKVTRRVDQRDRFKKRVISQYSFLNSPPPVGPAGDVIEEDDEKDAQGVADGIRRAKEAAVFAGSFTIPRITQAYDIGDKIQKIVGRNVSLRSNPGASAGESPIWPSVIAKSWNFDGKQETHLQTSDARAMPAPKRIRRQDEE